MKFTEREIIEKVQCLKAVSNKQLPVKVSYSIGKNLSKFESELKHFYKEREKLLGEYAEKDASGKIKSGKDNKIIFKDKNSEDAWNKEINELLGIENDIEMRKFTLDDIGNVQFSPAEMQAIDCMIKA